MMFSHVFVIVCWLVIGMIYTFTKERPPLIILWLGVFIILIAEIELIFLKNGGE